MKVSIIIVSYNVKYFLEQCLCSVKKAIECLEVHKVKHETAKEPGNRLNAEVFVVDNNSTDSSVQYLEDRFPFARFISNKENAGFAKANNQALRMACGEYILFLNPDTIIPENFFLQCFECMEKDQRIGALGVHMIDGTGKFLNESKRGFPTTWAAFCKLAGLTAIFPTSRLFAKYYLGHLSPNTSHTVDALSGACMMVKKDVMNECGGFDERFFMYAEDIDLSFRINESGKVNYYLADVSIIHFKGESTIRNTRYIKVFYQAMIQFVQKHYSGIGGKLYVQFLKVAIWFRALFAAVRLGLSRPKEQQELRKHTTFLAGDRASMQEISVFLPNSSEIKKDPQGKTNEIIFCEGEHFPFKEIIDAMKRSPGYNYKIHAFHSFSIVGSDDSGGVGTSIELSRDARY
ncbi:MAG: glycosyltransferase family 2 protein [Flavitalea sp.]